VIEHLNASNIRNLTTQKIRRNRKYISAFVVKGSFDNDYYVSKITLCFGIEQLKDYLRKTKRKKQITGHVGRVPNVAAR